MISISGIFGGTVEFFLTNYLKSIRSSKWQNDNPFFCGYHRVYNVYSFHVGKSISFGDKGLSNFPTKTCFCVNNCPLTFNASLQISNNFFRSNSCMQLSSSKQQWFSLNYCGSNFKIPFCSVFCAFISIREPIGSKFYLLLLLHLTFFQACVAENKDFTS